MLQGAKSQREIVVESTSKCHRTCVKMVETTSKRNRFDMNLSLAGCRTDATTHLKRTVVP